MNHIFSLLKPPLIFSGQCYLRNISYACRLFFVLSQLAYERRSATWRTFKLWPLQLPAVIGTPVFEFVCYLFLFYFRSLLCRFCRYRYGRCLGHEDIVLALCLYIRVWVFIVVVVRVVGYCLLSSFRHTWAGVTAGRTSRLLNSNSGANAAIGPLRSLGGDVTLARRQATGLLAVTSRGR